MSRGALCARPGCGRASVVVVTYDYDSRIVYLDGPGRYDAIGTGLCASHAERMTPPVGWQIVDRRVVRPLFDVRSA